MGLVINLIVQTIAWFGFMGAIIFGAAGTVDYVGGWLYLGEMIAISVVSGVYFARYRSGPVAGAAEAANPEESAARGQAHPHPPPAPAFRQHGVHGGGRRALALVDYAALCAMGRMRAPRRGDFVYVLDHAHEQLRGAGGEDPEGTWADRHHNRTLRDRAPPALFRRSLLCGRLADANYGPYAGISMCSVLGRFPWDWRDIHFHLRDALPDPVALRLGERRRDCQNSFESVAGDVAAEAEQHQADAAGA